MRDSVERAAATYRVTPSQLVAGPFDAQAAHVRMLEAARPLTHTLVCHDDVADEIEIPEFVPKAVRASVKRETRGERPWSKTRGPLQTAVLKILTDGAPDEIKTSAIILAAGSMEASVLVVLKKLEAEGLILHPRKGFWMAKR